MNDVHANAETPVFLTVGEVALALKLSYSRALDLVRAHPAVELKYGRWLLPASAVHDLERRDTQRGRRWPRKVE